MRILYICFGSLSSYCFFVNRVLYSLLSSLGSTNFINYSLFISLSFITRICCSRSLSKGDRWAYFYISGATPTIC
nr:MAG TPA: hypothetical protein [Caudoviricetes sp.]